MREKSISLLILSVFCLSVLLPSAAAVAISTCPVLINDSSTLSGNIQFGENGACITFDNHSIILDCNGYSILYGANLSNGTAINATDRTGITVRNCTIADVHAGSLSGQSGINFTRVNNSVIANSSISANGSATVWGIFFMGTRNTSILDSNITSFSNASNAVAVEMGTSSTGNSLLRSALFSNSTASSLNYGASIGIAYANTIANNTITVAGPVANNYGIWLIYSGTDNNTIANNSIRVVGDSGSVGIYLTAAKYNNFTGNFIRVNGTNLSGVRMNSISNNNRFTDNNITTNSTIRTYAVSLEETNHSVFTNNVFHIPGDWINASANTFNNFTNNTFYSATGTIRTDNIIEVNGTLLVTRAVLNVTAATAYVNSTALAGFNKTSEIIFYGLTVNDPALLVDFDEDRTFVPCAQFCLETSYSSGTYIFTATQFTSYTAQESAISTCPVTINVSSTLNSSIKDGVPNAACITFGASNLALECRGRTIEYGVNGTAGENSTGVLAVDRRNITIANCTIVDTNSSGLNSFGANLTRVNESVVANSTIQQNASSAGNALHMMTCIRVNVSTNTIFSAGGSAPTAALVSGGTGNFLKDNTITANGTGSNLANALQLLSSCSNIVTGNTVKAISILGDNRGIDLYTTGTDNNTVDNNTVFVAGENASLALRLYSAKYNNLTGNKINANGSTFSTGIYMDISDGNRLLNNNITTTSTCTNCYGIVITLSNNSRLNGTILTDPGQWLNTTPNSFNNISNITFEQPNGSIRLNGTFVLNGSPVGNVIKAYLNITHNKAYMNSTNLSLLNQTGVVALRDTGFSNPTPTVDVNDNGTFADCSESRCTEISLSYAVYSYGVTGFTTYGAGETAIFGSGGSGGGGGSGGVSRAQTYTMSASESTLSLKKSDKVKFRVANKDHTLTMIDVLTSQARVEVASLPVRYTLSKGVPQEIDFTGDGKADFRMTLVSIGYYQATLKLELPGAAAAACFENWVCEAWSLCTNGRQTRECTELNACGTTKLKPATQKDCTAPAEEPVPEAEVQPQEEVPPAEPVQREELPVARQQRDWTKITFYGIAILALIILIAYWYAASRKRQ